MAKTICLTAMNLAFLLTLNLSPKMSYDEYYVLIYSLILPITWILSIVLSSCNKKRRILTMKRKMLEMTKDNNPSENNMAFEFKSKIKRNNTKSCRKYITASKNTTYLPCCLQRCPCSLIINQEI